MRLTRAILRSVHCLLAAAVVVAALYAYERGWAWKFKGGLSRFCFDLLDFQYDNSGSIYVAMPFFTSYWVSSCEQVFKELGAEQQSLISALFDRDLPMHVLHPAMRLGWQQGKSLDSDEEREGVRRALAESPPRARFPLGPDAENLTRQVLAHSGGMELDWLQKHQSFEALGRPAQEPIVDASEVGRALREGRLVRFDATRILPPKTFNVTLERLSYLHGPEGDGISILAYAHESKECRQRAFHHRRANPVGALFCPRSPTIGEARRAYPNPSRMPGASRIALRRLPNYINEDALVKDLGLEGVERPEGQIIMGHAWGDTHWDEQDNLFIQASGVAVVLGVPAEYTDAVGGTEGHSAKSSGMDWDKWLEHDEVRKTSIPWYYMVLKPGDGIAIPSGAFHAVYGSHNRASLQTFLEPQYLGMRWDTNKHSYWHKETKTRQALRNIFFKTTGRLWDTKRVGMIQQGGCIEYL